MILGLCMPLYTSLRPVIEPLAWKECQRLLLLFYNLTHEKPKTQRRQEKVYLRKGKACVKSKGMKEIEEGFRVAVMPDE